jgi:CubicO group peptidase (beta-lactamase class C family)
MKSNLKDRVDAVIDTAIREKRIVGTVTLIAENGETIYRRAAGLADREAGRAMREDQLFRLSSVTKPIVSSTAMAMIEQGKIALGDPVTKWLPDFRPRLADGSEPTITLRHLLTHTSGIGYTLEEPEEGPYHRAKISDGIDQPGLSLEENLRRIASVPLLFAPGENWNYGLSLDVLGAVMARAGGAPLPEMVRKHVAGPLGMRDTDFSVKDRARLTVAYADGKPEPVVMRDDHLVPFGSGEGVRYTPSRVFNPNSYPSGGGGMVGSAGDVFKLLQTLCAGGAPILSEASVRAMTSDQIAPFAVGWLGASWGFGFGAAILRSPMLAQTPQSAGSYEWGGVYGHSWFVDPVRKIVAISLTNTALAGMVGAYPLALRDAIYGIGPDLSGDGLEAVRLMENDQ